MMTLSKILRGAIIVSLASFGITLHVRAQDPEVTVAITVTAEAEGGPLTVTVNPWRAKLEPGQRLTWTCSINRESGKSVTIRIPRQNALGYGPPEFPPNREHIRLAGTKPTSKPLRDDTHDVGQVYTYQILIPSPAAGVGHVLIDPEYERNR